MTAQMASAAMTSEVCRAIAVNSVGWHWSSPKQPSVHWLRDTAYAEDANTGYAGNGPRVMASLLNIAVSLLHLSGVLRSPHHPGLYRFRTHRRCCGLRFGRMNRLRQDRGLCPFACST